MPVVRCLLQHKVLHSPPDRGCIAAGASQVLLPQHAGGCDAGPQRKDLQPDLRHTRMSSVQVDICSISYGRSDGSHLTVQNIKCSIIACREVPANRSPSLCQM